MIDQVPLTELDLDEIGRQVGRSAEELALAQSIEYFGPLTPAFLEHIHDRNWQETLRILDEEVARNVGADPPDRLKNWTREDFPHLTPALKKLVMGMVRFTPSERLSMDQVMRDPSWMEK